MVPAEPWLPVWPRRQRQSHMQHGGCLQKMRHRSQTQWTCCNRWSLGWVAPKSQLAHIHAVFGLCGSSALAMSESEGMNGQIDWHVHQPSQLVYCLAGQTCSDDWETFWTRSGQSITAMITWWREELRKEAASLPPSNVRNNMYSTRQKLILFWEQPWGECWETVQFWAQWCHFELKQETEINVYARCVPPIFAYLPHKQILPYLSDGLMNSGSECSFHCFVFLVLLLEKYNFHGFIWTVDFPKTWDLASC